MTFKQKVHAHCMSLLNDKIQVLEKILHHLDESAASDTKSSAGDKHETARAMVQIEQENTRKQIGELLDQKMQLQKIDSSILSIHITKGSFVKTNRNYLFISIPLGKILVEGNEVIVISPLSPLGKKISGLKQGDVVAMNGMNYSIQKID